MDKFRRIVLLLCMLSMCVLSDAHVWGVVLDDQGEVLVSANVWWLGTTVGVSTDAEGRFSLEPVRGSDRLVVSYLGYHNDTILAVEHKELVVVLVSDLELDEVVITERKMSVLRSRSSALDTHVISGEELCKAACCNLSESFETNASVDVAYSDAATGAKQIRLLGLSGRYVQLLSENTPCIRGLASNYGMDYIPGPWMESIQVSKGTSSVINGYESTTGQINVEYLKPQTSDPIALNVMLNSELHAEANLTGGWDLNEHVSTGVLAHYQNGSMEMDENHDGFMDMPTGNQGNLLNRWYFKKGDYTGQLLVRGIYDRRHGGQMSNWANADGSDLYRIDLRTWRVDGFMKNGYVFDHERGTSIGVIAALSYHNQDNRYGVREWSAGQTNAYLNGIFQTSWGEAHKLSAGLSVNFDRYEESLSGLSSVAWGDNLRMETTAGVFGEYSYKYDERLSLLLGLRVDYSSMYGAFVTPRFNLRYSPWEWWSLRGSVGMGYRSPVLLSDNAGVLPSGRILWYKDSENGMRLLSGDVLKELKQERALNAGISTVFYIPLGSKELQLSGEYYYTHFFECVVADMDSDPHQVVFSNLNGGRSYAQSWQVEASMEILRGWTMTLAYRGTDVKSTYNGVLREKPLTNRFKGLITTSYQTPLKKWQFDLTAQFNGGGRMPDPDSDNPLWEKEYGWYPQLMGQVTKFFRTCSIYLGAENMTNFKQSNPVIGADDVWGENFDASMAWGPVSGWKVYLGFRWSLERSDD
ncbi:MAG: TonB-dependent receptor [Paludibacter sp.]|nr:TonB-dependent receptor [Bacteroidales bacterium]MCM1069337.1 TonB-dependent receptor [Prevotella sp.]MCM1353857.1 TonB-dependent receptor [Bacteroides sp.]MCM1442893.1 TonB-dependent receptor [Muribaculum sp.]MCM1481938.1 TonB-dependent receptor [Paludibacter sp.]